MASLPLPPPNLRPQFTRARTLGRPPTLVPPPRDQRLRSPPRRCSDREIPPSPPSDLPAPIEEEGEKNDDTLKRPLWGLGPSILLLSGMAPTLWLPLPAVFVGPDVAGVLALVGLDCLFNMGATLFLLMADACARPNGPAQSPIWHIPLGYKLWNMGASLAGLVSPLAAFLASHAGPIQPTLPAISFAVLLGPYLLLLSTQMLTEALTWHWKSPVWLIAPLVYEAYRVLQLMRGLKLAAEVAAPAWAVGAIRGLVSWWVLVLSVQLMRVAWFAGNFPQRDDVTLAN
ncbi:cytochrome P450 family protein [Wolffia australiana]